VKPTTAELDAILALQLTVAWAGEAAGEPARLGWWKSDLIDPEGGGDLFARLVPQTAVWASLILARKAAATVDGLARDKLANADAVWSLYHFGFDIDEQLSDRLMWHRNHKSDPRSALGPLFFVGTAWSTTAFEALLTSLGKPKVQLTPSGRKLESADASPFVAAQLLAAALLPLSSEYPLPFVEIGA
jgi:hypothetical protein